MKGLSTRLNTMTFHDRIDAARQLIPLLKPYANEDVVIMAVPRGAVPMGRYIADYYHWPLGVVLVKKIGHPYNPEYAIGAVGAEDSFIDEEHRDISDIDLQQAIEEARAILMERQKLFLGGHEPLSVRDKTVILVDDGIATGATLKASITIIQKQKPAKIIVAAPVASSYAVDELKRFADDVIVLHASSSFMAVGEYYENFAQVSDQEVVQNLRSLLS